MKKAWVENNRVRDIASGNPAEMFHPDIAALYDTDVPDDAVNGDGWDGVTLTKPVIPDPVPVEPPAPSIPLIGPIAFQMLFTVPELVAIDAARDGVPAIRIFWRLLDDPRTDYVDRNIAPVQSMLHSLEAGGLLGEGRANEIIHATL